jgi:hypothetical protein
MHGHLFSKNIRFGFTLFLIFYLSTWTKASPVSEYDDIQILKSDQDGVIFKYRVPELDLSKIELGGQTFDLVNIDKCAFSDHVEKPQLPVRKVIIGVPQEAEISIEILDKSEAERAGINLAYAAKAEPDDKSPVGYKLAPFKPKAGVDQFYPLEIVSFHPPTFLRNQRVIELEIFPVRYNSARKSIRYSSQITVKVSFSGGRKESFEGGKDLFEKIYQNVLLNYEQSKGWRKIAEERGLLKPAVVDPFSYSDNWYKIIVRENGIYKIDRNMLVQAGIPVSSLDPKTLRMFSGGGKVLPLDNSNPFLQLREISIFVSGEEDSTFDSEDFILFFGWSTNDWDYDSTGRTATFHTNPFTYDNVFWLTFNPTSSFEEPPKRMQVKNGSLVEQNPFFPQKFKSRIHSEQDNILQQYEYVVNYFDWYWMQTESARMFVSLPAFPPQDTCLVKVRRAGSQPSIRVNGETAFILDSLSSNDLTVARSLNFHGGEVDTVDISFPGNAYLDWYEIEYPRKFECYNRQLFFENPEISGVAQFEISNLFSSQVYLFDVTDYFDVKRFERFEGMQIQGEFARFQDTIKTDAKTRYFLVDESKLKKPNDFFRDEKSNLKEVSQQADFLIITHPDFYDEVQTLESFRESYNQMSVTVVDVQDIYDEFSGGLFDPVAIRDFLKFAYKNWEKPAPAFALLVGDGQYDYKNNLGTGSINFIPPFAPTWEGDNSMSDDNYVYFGRYGYLDSDTVYQPLDRRVDIVISRWPVRTKDEVTVVLDKVISYEKMPEFGTWRNLITLVADDEFHPPRDSAEAFHTQFTENLAKLHVPPSFNLSKIYLMEYPFDFKREKPEAEEAIINAFNSGALIINYMGHGNPDVWADERVFKRAQDIPRLSNQRKLPLVYVSSCSIGFFFNPFGEGMGEEFLRAEDKGAIATISATWLVYPGANADLNVRVYDLLLNQDISIGQALFIAKLLGQPNLNDRQYVLFGDPLMKLGAPQLRVELTDVAPETLSALSLVEIKGEVKDKNDSLIGDFNGTAKISAFDSQRKKTHTMPGGGKVSYDLPGLIMFKGDAEVKAGKFQASFVVPKDISYGGNTGRISVYLLGQNSTGTIGQDGMGVRDSLVIRGSDTTVIDTIGPQITINFDDRADFSNGETILPNSILKLSLFDEHGINMTGEVGHGITLMIDQDLEHQIDLSGNFEYEPGSYQKGALSYQLSALPEGDHNLTIKAWDNANNSSLKSVDVKVSAQRELKLTQVMNYPNPFSTATSFYYCLSSDADKVEVRIFTLAGRLIREIPSASARTGVNYSTTWDAKDQDGDEVANGVYIYKITAEGMVNGKQEKTEVFGKAVVVR